ncbi:MAG: hypothetical protein PUB96_01665 [Helicobacteraceae bacterium]|nr:hypothetical protein [Helicobacteraceae bacterium]
MIRVKIARDELGRVIKRRVCFLGIEVLKKAFVYENVAKCVIYLLGIPLFKKNVESKEFF